MIERAGQDTLGISTSLVKPFTGRVIFAEDLTGCRFTFYAPQVWTRQRKILMPTAKHPRHPPVQRLRGRADERHDRRRVARSERA